VTQLLGVTISNIAWLTYDNSDHGSILGVGDRMEDAMYKDRKESGGERLFRLKAHRTGAEEESSRVVQFHLLGSITDTQPIRVSRERGLGDAAVSI
jgi:hypothetical protein